MGSQIRAGPMSMSRALSAPSIPQPPVVPTPQQNGGRRKADGQSSGMAVVPASDVGEVVEGLNRSIGAFNSRVSFDINEATDRPVIQVIDNETGEMVRQVPPEDMLKALERMAEMVGLLVDERA